MDVYIIYLFESVSKSNVIKTNAYLIEQKAKLDNKYYKELEIQNKNYQRFFHDINKHLNVLKQMPGIDESYCNSLTEMINDCGGKFYCSNQVLNIIINNLLMLCDSKKIKVDLSVEDIELDFMDKLDITIIFLNLFDNVVEASEKLDEENRKISRKVSIKKPLGYV